MLNRTVIINYKELKTPISYHWQPKVAKKIVLRGIFLNQKKKSRIRETLNLSTDAIPLTKFKIRNSL